MDIVDKMREGYAKNLFRLTKHLSGLYGGRLTYPRKLPKYDKKTEIDKVDFSRPFCIYNLGDNITGFLSTPIFHNDELFLRYFEVIKKSTEDESFYNTAQIYNVKTNAVNILCGDPMAVGFLFLFPDDVISFENKKNLKLMY